MGYTSSTLVDSEIYFNKTNIEILYASPILIDDYLPFI
jgi:hypothetical protein